MKVGYKGRSQDALEVAAQTSLFKYFRSSVSAIALEIDHAGLPRAPAAGIVFINILILIILLREGNHIKIFF